MGTTTIRRIAAQLLQVGENKVRFKPDAQSKISEALTREDIRALISEGAIYSVSLRGVSRARARKQHEAKKKGRRRGIGTKKGSKGARQNPKIAWIAKVRAQRRYLRGLVQQGRIEKSIARKIYLMVKGNAFRGVKALEAYLKDNKLLKEK
ncbi:MAG: 50S ribosomal protein L19e [Candidatus Micrarchaeota archaeon]|nr:50S ribosomal protein L19e [Candidatus Micrarchaeota archaeon]